MYITLDKAISLLNSHQVVALPTETVYGLAARSDDEMAIHQIFTTKNRPLTQPLILHVSSIEMAKKYFANWNPLYQILAEHFWPGPLTMLCEKSNLVSPLITAHSSKVAIRFPRHELFLKIIESLNQPLVAPSANPHQQTSPTKASHVEQLFAGSIPVLDGGPCAVGVESTILEILSAKNPIQLKIARPGNITPSMIQNLIQEKLKQSVTWSQINSVVASGQQAIHYRPPYPLLVTNSAESPSLKIFLKNKSPVFLILNEDAEVIEQELYDKIHSFPLLNQFDLLVLVIPQLNPNLEKWNAVIDRLSKASCFPFYF
ncbi:MAG: L-threonylcarbamoyladenylate synthase [Bacteriovoracaceae bacterium]|nr:L-threonylcarbamoyladenylate synthase [Bacteriovoracaceae bacterium]